MRIYVGAILAAALAAGCGGGGDSGPAGTSRTVSCTFAGDVCNEITAVMTDAKQASVQTACTGGSGTFTVGLCDTAGTVAGHCAYTAAAVAAYIGISLPGSTMNEYYYTASWTSPEAQGFCTTPPAGTWIP